MANDHENHMKSAWHRTTTTPRGPAPDKERFRLVPKPEPLPYDDVPSALTVRGSPPSSSSPGQSRPTSPRARARRSEAMGDDADVDESTTLTRPREAGVSPSSAQVRRTSPNASLCNFTYGDATGTPSRPRTSGPVSESAAVACRCRQTASACRATTDASSRVAMPLATSSRATRRYSTFASRDSHVGAGGRPTGATPFA